MKKVRYLLMITLLVMMSVFLCSCGNNVEKSEVDQETEELSEEPISVPETVFTNFEEINQHKFAIISELENIYEQNNVGYKKTSNGNILLGNEVTYTLLDREYDITEIAYSLYNPEYNTIDTVFSFKYEIHEEKGIEPNSKHVKLLYDMLQYFGCNFTSVEALVTELNESNDVLYETDSVYIEARKYALYAAMIIREECDFTATEYKYFDFESLDKREQYMETLETTVMEKFDDYESNGGNIVDSEGEELIRFRCMDANDEAYMDNDLGIMVSLLNINPQEKYKTDCIELLKIICESIGIENITNKDITSKEIAEQLMTYVELEVYFTEKDEPFFEWQQEGGWDKLFSPVEFFESNPFGIQYENARYYEWNKGDNVYEGIYIPATVQGLKNR